MRMRDEEEKNKINTPFPAYIPHQIQSVYLECSESAQQHLWKALNRAGDKYKTQAVAAAATTTAKSYFDLIEFD